MSKTKIRLDRVSLFYKGSLILIARYILMALGIGFKNFSKQ
ncbi:hypothetical protein LEP1GSC074_2441 [Leptospira noguchii str. Hook]|uniref:Uncharacterized protein n=1 Tax=Leptospira noguchii serovar Autumnalis str. ZUN142 TaxID=1085540 RepID=M6UK52_9LEPT|nr:hypothetical protein LEP1GSC041_2032 [Leptospira noguchii str. 2006001870]EMI71828.1 hypothetical protein LEP1GSC072_3277 [Leptospira noguchii str. Bonito]EMO26707.1 hypothetical protein LEP1GSC170_0532 [Leptospira interrogans serovar Bataviae str. HAI135]EMO43191.1 hypothetical protein LEP1GSC186_2591 [Leptospira noguchii serovar Autumnalis str. ZUN142]EMS85118.1 hypothetical protein LEP1GSC074_2441 [Leptospira noguchii str. Hook]EMS87732.1 hypothetical protein LEP1GSC073_2377 [Leptospira 